MKSPIVRSVGAAHLHRFLIRGAAYGIPLLFRREEFETICFDSFISKRALEQTHSVCLRAI